MNMHTQGPWKIEINHVTGEPEFIRTFIRDEHGGEMYDIANMGCDETGNAAANARLIAAAPDLLRALREAIEIIEGTGLDASRQRDAISMATGEAA